MNLRTHLRLLMLVAVATATVLARPVPIKTKALIKPKLNPPSLAFPGPSSETSITVTVCAGPSGAQSGFLLQWQTADSLTLGPDGIAGTADDGRWYDLNDPRARYGLFPGSHPDWSLDPGDCTTLVIGGTLVTFPAQQSGLETPLQCGTTYLFRVTALADCDRQRSDYGSIQASTTDPCGDPGICQFCTRSQGYFSNGTASLAAMLACFGGDGGTGPVAVPTNTGPLIAVGGGTYTYSWFLTGTNYVDVDPSPLKQQGVDTGLVALREALGGNGPSGPFTMSANNPTSMGTGGGLASQTAALTLNISTCGDANYGKAFLCSVVAGQTLKVGGAPISAATAAALNGQTVANVLAAANAYLGNGGTIPFGLGSASALNELIDELNLAFDGKDWDGDGVDDHECGGKSEFGAAHICCDLKPPGDPCTKSQGYFSSGATSLEAELACFGGDGGRGSSPVTASGGPLITIGGGTFTYTWMLTQSYVDIDKSPKFRWVDTGLLALRAAIGGGGISGVFTSSQVNPITMGKGGGLASQTAALTLNLSSCGDATFGTVVLCRFVAGDTLKDGGTPISAVTAAALNGQTVAAVLNAANLYLGTGGAVPFGLASAAELNALIDDLNLAFDNPWDSDGDGILDKDCGGASAFATAHLCL